MKNNLEKIVKAIFMLTVVMFCSSAVSAAETHNVNLPLGKKIAVKGQVRAGNYEEQLYIFEAKANQKLSVSITSINNNAVFSVNNQYRVDRDAFEEDKTEWSGMLPESESNGLYSIAVTSTKGVASYTLEMTLASSGGGFTSNKQSSDGPKTVKDFYLLMPEKYNSYTREEREEALDSTETFIDIKNGYIGSQIGQLGERFQAAIFKRPDGGYIFAYNEDGDPSVDVATKFYLLKYENGEWTDVTTALLPVAVNKNYHYDLPNTGTTIKVTTAKGAKLYSLAWKNGKFEKL